MWEDFLDLKPNLKPREVSILKRTFLCLLACILPFPPCLPHLQTGTQTTQSFYTQLLPVNKELGDKGTKGSRPGNSLI